VKYISSLIVVCFALFCITLFYFSLSYFERREALKIPIKVIAQTGPLKEGLKTDYLAELLDLSFDHPKCLEIKEVKQCLLKNPLIKTVSASYLNPETLYIDYTLRTPDLTLLDFENRALDQEGISIPIVPYFTPKNLPELYLGLKNLEELPLVYHPKKQEITQKLKKIFSQDLVRIDLSHFEENSLGKRELVVIVKPEEKRHYLRLPIQNYEKQLTRYLSLQKKIQDQELLIDLRIPDLAYLTAIH
jgi:cell division septal protein FtsQ